MGVIDDALSGGFNFPQQSIIAKVFQYLCRWRSCLVIRCSRGIVAARIIRLCRAYGGQAAPTYRFVLKQAETGFQQTSRTDSLPRVGRNQSPALFARSKYSVRMNYPLNGQNFCQHSNPRSQMIPSTSPPPQGGVKCAPSNPASATATQ